MYVFEFSTLAAFAMAFRYWNENYVFPSAVLIGSGLMLVRFIIIYESGVLQETDADQSKKDLAALTIAIITLGLYVFVIIGALAVAFMGGMEPQKRLSTVHYVTTFLLLVGVVATLLAVDKAEGLKWGTPPCWLDQQTDCVSKFRVGFCTVISSELAAGTCELPWSTQETG